jgi:hypothetical protein
VDWHVWAIMVPFVSCSVGVYAFTATVPTVVKDLGYSSANAQLMTIPIYVFALDMTLGIARRADHAQQRSPFIMGMLSVSVIGFIVQLAIPRPKYPGLTYFFLFLIAGGLFSPFTAVCALMANNLAPSTKRAVVMALIISMGNLSGICSANIFFTAEAPRYPAGFGVCLGTSLAGIIVTYILRLAYQRENKRRDDMIASEGEEGFRARYTEQELLEMGDRSPFFRYTL